MVGGLILGLFLPGSALGQDIQIVSAEYEQNFTPGETVTFVLRLRNNDATNQFAEVDITLTEIGTTNETTLLPVVTGTIPPMDELILSQTYPVNNSTNLGAAAPGPGIGLFTVSFPLLDGNGVRRDTAFGRFPIQVGSAEENLRVFPEVMHLGTLPPGRFMYPTPIEVNFNFFRFNRLRSAQPFNIRVYTDNAGRYRGIPGAIRKSSPGGLISADGRYVIPVKIWSLNFGPDLQSTGWDTRLAGPPPVEEDDFWRGPRLLDGRRATNSASWIRIPDYSEMSANPLSWRRLVGQDPFDNRFVADANRTGDFTLASPFTLYMATETGPAAVEGSYSTEVIVELWSP